MLLRFSVLLLSSLTLLLLSSTASTDSCAVIGTVFALITLVYSIARKGFVLLVWVLLASIERSGRANGEERE